ncbi:MAG TPA: YihY/virulence factor BrkB family protein [Candidatus Pullilachnospira intestinigallinarum]|nr:YihY/virulence factor BrkB family protein [Candidatus Pullilachnospira intestinigallinarum]
MAEYIRIIRGFLKRLNQDHVGAFAAQAAYFILLSFVPFVILLITLVRHIPLVSESNVTRLILQIVPKSGDFQGFVLQIIREIFSKSTAVVPISAVFTLWSAGKGIQALTNGVNAIYHVKETRNYVIMRIRSAFYTLIFIIAVTGSLLLLVFGNSIQKLLERYVPMIGRIAAYIIGMRTVISLAVLCLVFLLIYKFLPNRKASLKSQLPGAIISALAWSLFSLGFSIYLDVFHGLSSMYGSLTATVLVLLWMYFCMYIVLIGAEINAYFEERFRRLQQMAGERIRQEYREFIDGLRESREEEEEPKHREKD